MYSTRPSERRTCPFFGLTAPLPLPSPHAAKPKAKTRTSTARSSTGSNASQGDDWSASFDDGAERRSSQEVTKLKKFSLKLKRENSELTSKLNELEAKNKDLEDKAAAVAPANAGADKKSENMKLKKLCAKLKKENAGLAEETSGKFKKLQADHDTATALLQNKVGDLESTMSRLETTADSTSADERAAALEAQVAELQGKLEASAALVSSLETELVDAKEGYQSSSDRHREQMAKAEKAHEKSAAALRSKLENAEAAATQAAAVGDRSELEAELAGLNVKLQEAEAKLAVALAADPPSAAAPAENNAGVLEKELAETKQRLEEALAAEAPVGAKTDALQTELAETKQKLEEAEEKLTDLEFKDSTEVPTASAAAVEAEWEAEKVSLQEKVAGLEAAAEAKAAELEAAGKNLSKYKAQAKKLIEAMKGKLKSSEAKTNELTDKLKLSEGLAAASSEAHNADSAKEEHLLSEMTHLKQTVAAAELLANELRASHEEESATMLNSIQQSQQKCEELLDQVAKKDGELTAQGSAIKASAKKHKVRMEAAEETIAGLTAKRDALEDEKSQLLGEADSINSESKGALTDLAAECSTLRTQVKQLEVSKAKMETQLEQEREDHTASKAKLTAATAGASNQNMMDLEIADYKRTAETLNTRLKSLEEQLERERKHGTDKEAKITELNTQIEREASLKGKDEETRLKLKTFLLKSKKELGEKRTLVTKLEKSERELQDQLEAGLQEVETLKTEITELNVALNKVEAEQRELDGTRDVAVHTLRFELESAKRDLKQSKTAFTDAQQELQNYKARAHTMLKQKADKTGPSEDELDKLKSEAVEAAKKLDKAMVERDQSRAIFTDLEADFDEQAAKLEVAAKEAARLQDSAEARERDFQTARNALEQEHLESVTQFRMEHSLVVRGQKARLAKQHAEGEQQRQAQSDTIGSLRTQLSDALAQAESGSMTGSTAAPRAGSDTQVSAASAAPAAAATVPRSKLGAPAASGSPYGGSPAHTPRSSNAVAEQVVHKVQDLATLLVSQVNPIADTTPEDKRSPGEKQAAAYQRQIQHLSTLLAESESTCERMDEQSKVLKQEIRRHEKNSNREEGANLEYLKNVIFKFITAQEEREHLIPALGMLLHFTKEEIADATKSFKKNKAAAQAAAAAAAAGSESSFFPRW